VLLNVIRLQIVVNFLHFNCRKRFTSPKGFCIGKSSLSEKIMLGNVIFFNKDKKGFLLDIKKERKQAQNKTRFKGRTMLLLPAHRNSVGTVRVRHHDPAGMDNPVSCNLTCSFNGTSRHAGPRFYALMRREGLPTPVRKNSSDHCESL